MHKTHATHVVAKRSGSRVIVLTKKYGQQNKTKKNKKKQKKLSDGAENNATADSNKAGGWRKKNSPVT